MTTTIGSATTTPAGSLPATSPRIDHAPAAGVTPPSSALRPVLLPGDTVASDDGHYTFTYQTDGNLVLYMQTATGQVATWASNTAGQPVGAVIMQGDGNLVIYGPGQKGVVWASDTYGNPGSWLVVQEDGNVVIYAPDGSPLWNTDTWVPVGPAPSGPQMEPGDVLIPGAIMTSASGQYSFTYQADGNLVLYVQPGSQQKALWDSDTGGKPAGCAIMQTDGNLVAYEPGGHPLWASNTAGNPGSRLEVQDDGNVVVYRPDNTPIWATNTSK